MTTFPNALSEEIWRSRYRFEPPGEAPEPSHDPLPRRVDRRLRRFARRLEAITASPYLFGERVGKCCHREMPTGTAAASATSRLALGQRQQLGDLDSLSIG